MGFQFGECHFNRVQVRTVRWQEEEPAAVGVQGRLGFFVPVGGKVIEDHGGAFAQRMSREASPLDHPRRDQIGGPQPGNQGLGDITLPELAGALASATGVVAHAASIGRFLRKLGYTYKKSHWSRPNGCAHG